MAVAAASAAQASNTDLNRFDDLQLMSIWIHPFGCPERMAALARELEVRRAVEHRSVGIALAEVKAQPPAGTRVVLRRLPVELVHAVAEMLESRRARRVFLEEIARAAGGVAGNRDRRDLDDVRVEIEHGRDRLVEHLPLERDRAAGLGDV